jgi:hypothetical protein
MFRTSATEALENSKEIRGTFLTVAFVDETGDAEIEAAAPEEIATIVPRAIRFEKTQSFLLKLGS